MLTCIRKICFLCFLIFDFVHCQVPVAPKPPDFSTDFSKLISQPVINGEELEYMRSNALPDQLRHLREKTIEKSDGIGNRRKDKREDVVRRVPDNNNLTESIIHELNAIEDISDFSLDSSDIDDIETFHDVSINPQSTGFKKSSKFDMKRDELEQIHNTDASINALPPFAFSEDEVEPEPVLESFGDGVGGDEVIPEEAEIQSIDKEPLVVDVDSDIRVSTTRQPSETFPTLISDLTPPTSTPFVTTTIDNFISTAGTTTSIVPSSYSTNFTTTRVTPSTQPSSPLFSSGFGSSSKAFTYTTRHPSSPTPINITPFSGRIPNPLHYLPRSMTPRRGVVDSAIPQFPAFRSVTRPLPRAIPTTRIPTLTRLQTEFVSTEFGLDPSTSTTPSPRNTDLVVVKQAQFKRRSESGIVNEQIRQTSDLLNLLGDRISGIDQQSVGIHNPRTAVMKSIYDRGEVKKYNTLPVKYGKMWGKTTHGRLGRMTYDGQFNGLATGVAKQRGGGYTVRKHGRYYTKNLKESPKHFSFLQRQGKDRKLKNRGEWIPGRRIRGGRRYVSWNREYQVERRNTEKRATQDQKNFAETLMETEEESMRQLKKTLRLIRDVVKFKSDPVAAVATMTTSTQKTQETTQNSSSFKGSFDNFERV